MSNAKPMGDERRMMHYRRQRGQRPGHLPVAITPRQAVRWHHKRLRAQNAAEPVDVEWWPAERPKGLPTPRQRKPRRRG